MVNNNKINAQINNLIALRNIYFSVIVVVTGGLLGLFYNFLGLNIVLFVLGSIIDLFLLLIAKRTSDRIIMLIKNMEE